MHLAIPQNSLQSFRIRIVKIIDLEYEEESMDGEGAAGGSARQCYTLGRANLEHSPKPSQMVWQPAQLDLTK